MYPGRHKQLYVDLVFPRMHVAPFSQGSNLHKPMSVVSENNTILNIKTNNMIYKVAITLSLDYGALVEIK